MIRLDAATFLLQWATGGLVFLFLTTRRREVGLGYGWLLRAVFGLMALASVLVGVVIDPVLARDLPTVGVVLTTAVVLGVAVRRRGAGVAGQRSERARRRARVASMTGGAGDAGDPTPEVGAGREFPPRLDLVAPVIGVLGLVLAGTDTGGPVALSVLRLVAGAAFLGAITDAMLLGHWYLVQPGLSRGPLLEVVRWAGLLWPIEVAALLVPTGMVSVLDGSIDDGYGGILGWMWLTCAATTIVLIGVTRAALRERQYSAVMAATGLLYLAILTAFGTDLVARAVLAS